MAVIGTEALAADGAGSGAAAKLSGGGGGGGGLELDKFKSSVDDFFQKNQGGIGDHSNHMPSEEDRTKIATSAQNNISLDKVGDALSNVFKLDQASPVQLGDVKDLVGSCEKGFKEHAASLKPPTPEPGGNKKHEDNKDNEAGKSNAPSTPGPQNTSQGDPNIISGAMDVLGKAAENIVDGVSAIGKPKSPTPFGGMDKLKPGGGNG